MNRRRLLDYGFVAALGAVGALHLRFIHRPAVREVAELGHRLNETRAEICRSEDFTRGLADLERYLKDFEDSLGELDRLVPEHGDGDDRVREIAAVVGRFGLSANSIRPDPAEPSGTVSAHPLTVKLSGGFAQLLAFLFEVERLPRHTRVTRLSLRSEVDRRGTGGTVAGEVELTAYSVAAETGGAE